MKASEILSKAADLIEPEGRWFQGDWAGYDRDGDGVALSGCHWGNSQAQCWCLEGALRRVRADTDAYDDINFSDLYALLETTIGVPISFDEDKLYEWNDAPERTQAEVVSALREAASLAKEQEGR